MRSIAITGVMPLPAARKSTFSGGGSDITKSPLGAASRMIEPGSRPETRWEDKKPSGIARTVIEIVRPLRLGGEEIEYERQWNLPLTWIPMPTY